MGNTLWGEVTSPAARGGRYGNLLQVSLVVGACPEGTIEALPVWSSQQAGLGPREEESVS